MNNPSLIIQNRLSVEAASQIAKNRLFLTSVIKCIGLRGNRDEAESESLNQGNFKALLNVHVNAIVSTSEGRGVNQGQCESDSEKTVGTDDNEYEDGEKESSEAEDVELVEPESPKLKAAKKKIKPLSETRWVERHTAFQDFEDLYELLMLSLETIALCKSRKKWDAKSKTEAQGLFHQIKNPAFIAAFDTAKRLFGFTIGLSRSLQGSTLDVIKAYTVKDQLADIGKHAKTVFAHSVHEKIQKMAKKADVKFTIPRTCGSKTLRNNTNAKTPVAYFCRTLFVPFLDNLLQQMNTRFNALSQAPLLGLLLINSNLQRFDKCSQEKPIQHYSTNLPSPSSVSQELKLWRRFWYVFKFYFREIYSITLIYKPVKRSIQ